MSTPPIGRSRSNSHVHPQDKDATKPVPIHRAPSGYAFGSASGTSRIPVSTTNKNGKPKKALPGSTTEVTFTKLGDPSPQTASPAGAVELPVVEPKPDKQPPPTKPQSLSFLTAPTAASKARQQKPVRAKQAADPDDSKHVIKAGSVTPREKIVKPAAASGSLPIPPKETARPSLTDVFRNVVGSPREVIIQRTGKSSPGTNTPPATSQTPTASPPPVVTPRRISPPSTLRSGEKSTPPTASPKPVIPPRNISPQSTLRIPSTPPKKDSPPPSQLSVTPREESTPPASLQTPQPVAASAPPLTIPSPHIQEEEKRGIEPVTSFAAFGRFSPREEVGPTPLPVTALPDMALTAESLNTLFSDRAQPSPETRPIPILGKAKDFRALVLTERFVTAFKSLELSETDISDDQLSAIIEKFPFLLKVTFTNCPKISGQGVKALQYLKDLKSLTIRSCQRILPSVIESLPLDQLEIFALSTGSLIGESLIQKLIQNKGIRKINFDHCGLLKPEVLRRLNQAQSQKLILSIEGCKLISEEDVQAINQGREHPIKVKTGKRQASQSKAPAGTPNFLGVDFTKFGSAGEMMRALLTQGDDSVAMAEPELPAERPFLEPPSHAEPEPFLGQFLDAETLNDLFPDKRRVPVSVGNLDRPEPIPILASEEEIRSLSVEGIENVTHLQLCSSLSNAQLEAIFSLCPLLEKVTLTGCQNLTNAVMTQFSRLPHLKEIDIRQCTQITEEGLKELPLDRLRKFALSTDAVIRNPQLFAKLAANQVLKHLEFEFCPYLEPQPFLLLAKVPQRFILRLRGCDQILKEHTEALNQGRIEPITMDIIPEEEFDFNSFLLEATEAPPVEPVKSSRKLCVPPPIQQGDDVASRRTFSLDKDPSSTEPLTFPHHEVIRDHLFRTSFRGCDLTGSFSREGEANQVLRIFETEAFRGMREVRIWDHPDSPVSRSHQTLSSLGPLRALFALATLYLGKLPGVRQRELELLFSRRKEDLFENEAKESAPKETPWEELTDLHLAALPVSDEVLRSLATFPKLKNVTLANSESFTFQGLNDLMGSKSLEKLVLVDCHSIDPFATDALTKIALEKRGKPVTITAELSHDLSAVEMAKQEALEKENDEERAFFWPDLKNPAITLAAAQEFYLPQLKQLGIQFKIDSSIDLKKQLKRYDRTILAYIDIHRSAWAIIKEMIRTGFFTNQEKEEPPPTTVKELLAYIDPQRERPRAKKEPKAKTVELDDIIKPKIPPLTANERRRQVKDFDFRDLRLTHIPGFIKECGYWEGIQRKMKIDGNPDLAPASVTSLEAHCPLKFEGREKLILKNWSGVTSEMIKKLFLKDLLLKIPKGKKEYDQIKAWPQLNSIDFEEVPITDEVFTSFAGLSIKEVRLARCHLFSVLGLKYLMTSDAELQTVAIEECPTIDPFAFQALNKQRVEKELNQVTLTTKIAPDPSALQMALDEAEQLLHQEQGWESYVRPEWKEPSKTDELNAFYAEQLTLIGHTFTLNEEPVQPVSYHWARAELIIQSYVNICRSAWAIWLELVRAGISPHRFPKTVEGLIDLLDTSIKNKFHETGEEMTYGDKVEKLSFSGLDLTRIPSFVEKRFWRGVIEMDISSPPDLLVKNCPNLKQKANWLSHAPREYVPPVEQKGLGSLWNGFKKKLAGTSN